MSLTELIWFSLYVCVCFGLLVLVLTSLYWTVWLPKDKCFSVHLQRASSDPEVRVYSVVMLSSQSCSSYCFLLQKMLYDRLREPFCSSCTPKLLTSLLKLQLFPSSWTFCQVLSYFLLSQPSNYLSLQSFETFIEKAAHFWNFP